MSLQGRLIKESNFLKSSDRGGSLSTKITFVTQIDTIHRYKLTFISYTELEASEPKRLSRPSRFECSSRDCLQMGRAV